MVVDQAGKAIAWRGSGTVTVNAGSDVVAPWLDATSRSSLGGALLDLAGVLVLTTAAVLTVRRCHDRLLWWAVTLNIAGWTSNLLDRLGLHWLTAPSSRRGTVDWLHGYNLADLVIWAGCALALAWLAREVLVDVGWDLRQPRHRVVAAVATAVVTGLVLVGMTSTDGSTRPGPEPAPAGTSAPDCRDPELALAPDNLLLCAEDPAAARPMAVASAVACPTEGDTAIVHVTLTNPNRDRRARFSFAASGAFTVSNDAAAHGQVEPGGAIRVRLFLPRRTDPTLLYLETAVQVWNGDGSTWILGTSRLWTTDLCEAGTSDAVSAQAALLCSPTGMAQVALVPRPLGYGDEHQPVVLSWPSPMDVTVDPGERPRRSGLAIDLADRSLSVVRVTPRTVADVLVVTGWGAGTIQYRARTARRISLPVGRCLEAARPGTSAARGRSR